MLDAFENLIYEKKEGVAKITLNRPEVLNAINMKMASEMNVALKEAEKDSDVKVVVLRGSGERAFCCGLDIKEFKGKTAYQLREFLNLFLERTHLLINLSKPTIACVNGLALGGGFELALSCDMIVASEKAKFGVPEINLGVFPGIAVALLPRLIGRAKTFELIYTGRMIDAKEAEQIGLLNKITSPESLEEEVDAVTRDLIEKSPVALKLARHSIYHSLDMEYTKALADACATTEVCITSEDAQEGLNAFLEKRKPKWVGR